MVQDELEITGAVRLLQGELEPSFTGFCPGYTLNKIKKSNYKLISIHLSRVGFPNQYMGDQGLSWSVKQEYPG